ncbi:RimK family alpha-L-glutamate ligase [Nocardioides sp.]|uniref:ATP-grasp domain-containing protein n=1 Tax=Nocardioides sp. TaxID=35761 RepID=UPI00356448EB
MTTVLLATFQLMPEGEYGGEHLVAALAERDVHTRWVSWDDPAVDWADADLVVVRSTWDYHRRCADFLAWARTVEESTALLNGAEVFTWNADKAYLVEIADRIPTVPTLLADDADLVGGLRAGLEAFGTIVVKARTGAGGIGVVVIDSLEDDRLAGLTAGPWVVQPLVESVRTVGETSVFVLDGRAVSQVDKLPAAGEIRVHEHFGGASRAVALTDPAREAAEHAIAEASRLLGRRLDYGRVDLMEYDGRLVAGELELIEPGLYLDVHPANAEPFADLVVERLEQGR